MFTIDQIKAAHADVKSGSDFPVYVHQLLTLGIEKYQSFVNDGHAEYFGSDGCEVHSDAIYSTMSIGENADPIHLVRSLKAHQQGETDYIPFCIEMANAGVEQWTVDTQMRTCTYYGTGRQILLTEVIPEP